MTAHLSTSRSRRQMLGAALGSLGALAVTFAGKATGAAAATGGNFVLGQDNTADATSRHTSTMTAGNGVEFIATGNAVALHGQADGAAITALGTGVGMWGSTDGLEDSFGVRGSSGETIGVFGESTLGIGVLGSGSVGVYGQGAVGLIGDVDSGCGVQGWTGANLAPEPTANTGVWAGADPGRIALQVSGRARFSRSGRATFAANTSQKTITVPGGVFTTTFAMAVLNSNRPGVFVRAVVPNSTADTITIYLNQAVSSSTSCAWIAFS